MGGTLIKHSICVLVISGLCGNSAFSDDQIEPLRPQASFDYRLSLEHNDGDFGAPGERAASTKMQLDFFDANLSVPLSSGISFQLKYDVKRRAFYWAYAEFVMGSTHVRAGINLTLEGGYDNRNLSYLSLLSSPYTLEVSPMGGVAPMLELSWPEFELGHITIQFVTDVAAKSGNSRGNFSQEATQPAWMGRWQFTVGYIKPSITLGVYDTNQSNFKVISAAYERDFLHVYADYVYDVRASTNEFAADERLVTYYASRSLELNYKFLNDWQLKLKYMAYYSSSESESEGNNQLPNGTNSSFSNNLKGWAAGLFFQPDQPMGLFTAAVNRAGVFKSDETITGVPKEGLDELRYLFGVVGKL